MHELLCNNSLFVGQLYEDKSLPLCARDLIFFTTDRQTVNYYTTIHALELIYMYFLYVIYNLVINISNVRKTAITVSRKLKRNTVSTSCTDDSEQIYSLLATFFVDPGVFFTEAGSTTSNMDSFGSLPSSSTACNTSQLLSNFITRLQVSSADNLGKQFGPRSDPSKLFAAVILVTQE